MPRPCFPCTALPLAFLLLSCAAPIRAAQAEAAAPSNVPVTQAAARPYVLEHRYPLAGTGGWDYLSIDAPTRRLYVTRGEYVVVMDSHDGSVVATIPDTPGVHGVALATDLGLGFTSNGANDTIGVFRLGSYERVATWSAGGHHPDAILYEPASRRLYSFNRASRDISVLDPATGELTATIAAGGKPEFAVADGAGRVFVNIEDRAELLVIDGFAEQALLRWSLAGCTDPSGLALDAINQRLFSVCANEVMVVTDARSGRQVVRIPIGRGADAVAFDPERQLIFSANGQDGTLTVVHEDAPDRFSVVETVKTRKSARTLALDTDTHQLFLSSADIGPPPAPTAEAPHPRGSVLPGSFSVLVVGN